MKVKIVNAGGPGASARLLRSRGGNTGKRIRMDEPPPPEYDASPPPMTPMTPFDSGSGEVDTAYTPYYQPEPTPMDTESFVDSDANRRHSFDGDSTMDHADTEFLPPAPVRGRGRGRGRGGRGRGGGARGAAAAAATAATGGTPGRKRGRGGRRTAGDRVEEESLYNLVKNGKVSLQTVVDDWIEFYKMNKDTALLQLLQFFISASGCKGKITPQMQSSMEHAAIIRKMTEEFDEESGEYPLIQSGQIWKKFKSSFCDFVGILVKQCQYSIIYDQYLMDNLIALLTGLSDSQVRAFRHTATLAAVKLMTALVDVALTVSVNLDNTQRQYNAERNKIGDKRVSDRLENLLSKRTELEENMEEIKNMLTYMFKSVFVHRYRDTLPEIRAMCMSEIGIWMKKFHQNFLDDSYLKYIGWTLHDKVGEVRLRCLLALQPLYSSDELKGKLELFTSKFKDRIVSMTLDKDYDVAVQAVKLVIEILKHHRDILSDKDCEHVYELVYSSHRAVACAAGEFLNERLFVLDEEAQAETKTRRGKKRLPNTPLIRDLVQFFIESELHEHGAYLVDSLIDSNEMVKDWECMTDLLLEEPGPQEEPLDDRQETSLIEIMVCAVKQAATGEPPVGRGTGRKLQSTKEVKQIVDDKTKLTEHFMVVLPHLLGKFLADPEKIGNLMLIPQYFDLELYTTRRQEKSLEALLNQMITIVDKHTDSEVLETCAKTLEVLCDEEYAISSKAMTSRGVLLDNVVSKFKEALDEYNSLLAGGEEPDEDEIFALVSSLKKVSIFYSCHNLGHLQVWDLLFQQMKDARDGQSALPLEAVRYCISSCQFALMWDLVTIEDMLQGTGPAAHVQAEVDSLKNRMKSYMETALLLIQSASQQDFKEEAYLCVCDLMIIFGDQLSRSSQTLSALVHNPDKNLQTLLNEFIQAYIFIEDDDSEEQDEHSKIEELHKRRNYLASFCKLIVYSVLPTKAAADVFKHYVRFYNDYGDIIKTTIGKTRETNKVNCARTMIMALIMVYKELQEQGLHNNRHSDEFTALKELSKRFALSFGLDNVKNREAITAAHREGVLFAVNGGEQGQMIDPTQSPPNLGFLDVLTEFSNKLIKQDKRVVLAYLDKRISSAVPSSRGEEWQPLHAYRNSLVHGEDPAPAATTRKAYTRKRKAKDEEDEEEEDDDEDLFQG